LTGLQTSNSQPGRRLSRTTSARFFLHTGPCCAATDFPSVIRRPHNSHRSWAISAPV